MKTKMSKTDCNPARDMTEAAMETTMQQLRGRFQAMSEQLESRIDQMGTRIVDLEKKVAELMAQAGMEEQPGSE